MLRTCITASQEVKATKADGGRQPLLFLPRLSELLREVALLFDERDVQLRRHRLEGRAPVGGLNARRKGSRKRELLRSVSVDCGNRRLAEALSLIHISEPTRPY